MAKIGFSNKYQYTILGDGILELKEPSNKEWNEYKHDSIKINRVNKKNAVIDMSGVDVARATLFDKICVGVVNLEDENGKITHNDLQRIPDRFKCEAIMKIFEVSEDEDYLKKK
jgi:hypothetical protein